MVVSYACYVVKVVSQEWSVMMCLVSLHASWRVRSFSMG